MARRTRAKSANDFFNQASAFYRARNTARAEGDTERANRYDSAARAAERAEFRIRDSKRYQKSYNSIENRYYERQDAGMPEHTAYNKMMDEKNALSNKKFEQRNIASKAIGGFT